MPQNSKKAFFLVQMIEFISAWFDKLADKNLLRIRQHLEKNPSNDDAPDHFMVRGIRRRVSAGYRTAKSSFEKWMAIKLDSMLLISPPKSRARMSTLLLKRATSNAKKKKTNSNYPRIWNLFSVILSKYVRETIYEPAFNDFLETYMEARRKYRTKWACRWLQFAFTFRTLAMVFQCLQASMTGPMKQFAWKLLPSKVKQWWFTL